MSPDPATEPKGPPVSDPATPELYVVELTADELALVRSTLGRTVAARRKPTPRVKVSDETIATGDPALDAFMLRARARGAKAMTCPKPPRPSSKLPRLTVAAFEQEERDWASMAADHASGVAHHGVGYYLEAVSKHAALVGAIAARS